MVSVLHPARPQTLKLMGRSPGDRITQEIGREICVRTSSKALLTGSISIDAPDMYGSMYYLAFLRGDETAMRQQLNWAIGKTGVEYEVFSLESDTQAYHGRLAKARELYATAKAAALRDDVKETAAEIEAGGAPR